MPGLSLADAISGAGGVGGVLGYGATRHRHEIVLDAWTGDVHLQPERLERSMPLSAFTQTNWFVLTVSATTPTVVIPSPVVGACQCEYCVPDTTRRRSFLGVLTIAEAIRQAGNGGIIERSQIQYRVVDAETPRVRQINGDSYRSGTTFNPITSGSRLTRLIAEGWHAVTGPAYTTTEGADMPETSVDTMTLAEAVELAGVGVIVTQGTTTRGYRYRVDRDGEGWTLQRLDRYDTAQAPGESIYFYGQNNWVVTGDTLDADDVTLAYMRPCNQCGDTVNTYDGDYDYCDECDNYNCSYCGTCCESYSRDDYGNGGDGYGVHSWNYRPEYVPKGDARTGALFGIELEVGGSRSTIANAVRGVDVSEDHLYMKDDGSISGVEIVTHPQTLDYAAQFPFTPLLESLTSADCYVDDGYGLHIHVDRNAFLSKRGKRSVAHQMSWLMFLYRNTAKLELLARRRESRWASFRKPRGGELKQKATRAAYEDDRYLAVNTNNRPTYELRFFKSTLEPREFYGAIEFADASVEYTRALKTPDILQGGGMKWEHFTAWVSDRSDRYANLVTVLSDMETSPRRRFLDHDTDGGY